MNERSFAIYRPLPRGATGQALNVTEFGMHTIRSQIVDRRLGSYAVVLVENGIGRLQTEFSGTQPVVGPALFWLVAGAKHSYGPNTGTAWQERWAVFEGALAGEFEQLKLIDRDNPIVALDGASDVVRLFSALHTEMLDHSPIGRSGCGAALHRLAVHSARVQQRTVRAPVGELRLAMEAIKTRAFQHLDLSALAREFGVSLANLRRRCVETYGVPPKVLQVRLRLDRAKEQLAVSEETVETIAERVGFGDPFYFSRVFLKHEGCSPSAFRRSNRRQ